MSWFKDGLHFSCNQCGNCCTGASGYVWCNEQEMQELADYLGLTFDNFTKRYVRQVNHSYSLIEKPQGDCIFWEQKKGCTVYPARPQQCRTYPFWPEVISNSSTWSDEGKNCLGIRQSLEGTGDKVGQHHSFKKILDQSKIAQDHDPELD